MLRRYVVLAILLCGLGLSFVDAQTHRSGIKPTVKDDGTGFPTPAAPPTPPPGPRE